MSFIYRLAPVQVQEPVKHTVQETIKKTKHSSLKEMPREFSSTRKQVKQLPFPSQETNQNQYANLFFINIV